MIGVVSCKFDPITKVDYKFLKEQLDKYEFIYLTNKKSNKELINLVNKDKRIIIGECNIDHKVINYKPTGNEALKGNFKLLDKKVVNYIFHHGLYYREIVKKFLKEKRYKHSVSVANLCVKLAKVHKLDSNKAYIAGILHDIYKEIDKEKSFELMNKYFKELVDKPYAVHHAYTATVFIKNNLLIDDMDILDAIYHHTMGSDEKPLSKVLFIADKIDPLRGYDISKELTLALLDLDEGFKLVKNEQIKYLKKEGING